MGDEKKAEEEHGADAKDEESDIKTSAEPKNIDEERNVIMKEEAKLDTKDEDNAAVKIQSAYKGFRTRKKVAKMMTDDEGRKEREKKSAKQDKEGKRNDEELKLKEGRDERARRLKETFEEIDDAEFKYKQEMRKKLKEEKSLSIF